MQLKPGPRSRPRGFMLIEVLVAMLLAGLGVLALAGVHATALRLTRMSQHRVVAAQLASDLLERLRANRAGALAAQGSPYQFTATASQTLDPEPAATACDDLAASCSPVQFAQADAAQWRGLLRRSLPGAAAHVQLDASRGVAQVWVAWRDAQPAASDEQPPQAAECPAALGHNPGQRCVVFKGAW